MGVRMAMLVLAGLLAVSACAPQRALQWQPRSYTVQPGDTLYSIAFRHRLDWRELAAWNRIDGPGYLIRPGQTLRLYPGGGPAHVPPTAPVPPPAAVYDEVRWRWPAEGELVARFNDGNSAGKGIGIAGRSGQPIFAAAGGRVVYTGSGLVGYGQLIIVKHNNQLLSAYAHNREILVREGDEIRAGQRIATMGEAPGRRAMLHFEIRVDGRAVDPLVYLPEGGMGGGPAP